MTRRRVLIVVSDPADLPEIPRERLITADQYLSRGERSAPGMTVVNLCRSYRYRSKGYYVSLIAEARGQRVLPSVEAIEGLSEPFGIFRVLREAGVRTVGVDEVRPHRPADGPAEAESRGAPAVTEVLAYFGHCPDPAPRLAEKAAQAAHREWPAPVLRLQLVTDDGECRVAHVAPVPLRNLSPAERAPLVAALLDEERVLRRGVPAPRELKRASIAVLVDEADPFSPSCAATIDRLARVADRMNVYVQRLGPDEIDRLGEHDALFIRTLTGVREPSFQFALRAEMLDMPVIDDPQSIIRCSNKVFLEELLHREGIPTPRTLVLTSRTPWAEVAGLGTPVVVKLPDGSFSAAVHKIEDEAEYERVTGEMFRRSPLLIAQEFLPTEYDWRVTVLGGRVLFAARYHMARGHWQIRSEGAGGERYGKVEAVPRAAAPREVVELALGAAALIGDGLYGVDIKETPAGPVVIEVNDNPNLDLGYDDVADGAAIYEDVIGYFLRRIDEPVAGEEAPAGRRPAGRRPEARARPHYRPFEVAGMELEYAVVNGELDVVPLVEDAFRAIAGRPTSDVHLEGVSFSNEIADHVFEVKTPEPTRSLRQAEAALVEGVRRFSEVLSSEFGARLLPTGMHPWFDPRRGRLWARSNARVYQTYARLFDVHTHGWMNVHAAHLNLPLGRETEGVAMYNAAALLIPYLPALAASTPVHDGRLQDAVDARMAWILVHQDRVPESCGAMVPEYIESFADFRRRILQPMYQAIDALPDAGAIRHDFLNARGAVLKFSRKALEIRVLDTQECVRMDVAIAVLVRSALRHLAQRLEAGRLALPDHALLAEDLRAVVRDGSAARVRAPHLGRRADRGGDGRLPVRAALRELLAMARRSVRRDEAAYLDLVERVVEQGPLSERIRAALLPHAGDEAAFAAALRRVYAELADCLVANEPWRGRGADVGP
jgi:glutathione synthase/RimK-type ligase-like ATP-grasp enzyme/gamma-glutamyl:cysteine ligase YbdK (ATP-grasp superfamily)